MIRIQKQPIVGAARWLELTVRERSRTFTRKLTQSGTSGRGGSRVSRGYASAPLIRSWPGESYVTSWNPLPATAGNTLAVVPAVVGLLADRPGV
jgi:hypothetical protein